MRGSLWAPIGVGFHEPVEEAVQRPVHGAVVVGAQDVGRLHVSVRGERPGLRLGSGDQPFDHVGRELHVALEAIDKIAVLDDLSRASCAVGDDLRIRGQARHVIVPVARFQHVAKVRELAIRLAFGRQHDRELADFLLRAVLAPGASNGSCTTK